MNSRRQLVALACLAILACWIGTVHVQGSDLDPRVATLLAKVSEERLAQILRTLQSFETRNTLSDADSPTRGIGAARQWILDELKRSSPRLQVSFDAYQIPAQGERITKDVELRNVMAVLPGRTPRRIYVSGHYDSTVVRQTAPTTGGASRDGRAAPPSGLAEGARPAFDPQFVNQRAPGVNDDGSGTALTMELARVFAESGIEFEATLVFIAFAGEEQGLIGARLHAQKADAEKLPIDAVLNNDIVGNPNGGNGITDAESVRVFSEGPEDSRSRQLARYIRRQAARYIPSHRVVLIARHDRFGRGGDHTALNQHGFAAVRMTESNENYARQHTVEDTFEGVSPPYLARNARVNAAAVASMALAPPAPNIHDDRGRPQIDRGTTRYDARLRWAPSPGAAGYRIFRREAWTSDWQHEMDVGNVVEVVLPNVSIDDYVFGVAAVGPGGHESMVSAYVTLPRDRVEVKTR